MEPVCVQGMSDSESESRCASSLDMDDGPSSKRAKLGSAEPDGQFHCDECDKTFAKHSSLARHKYEHSGTHPFPYLPPTAYYY